MPYRRVFVCYTHPSQFQDRHHRRQVKSYVSTRAYWIEQRIGVGFKHGSTREIQRERTEKAQLESDGETSLNSINRMTECQAPAEKRPSNVAGTQLNRTGCSRTVMARRDSSLKTNQDEKFRVSWATSPLKPIDSLPGILHRQSQGFATANEFYLEAVDANYTPIFHVFDVVNILGNNYHRQMQDEDALHAGVAAMQVIRGTFLSSCSQNGPSEEVLRFVQIAISKLRRRIAGHDFCNDDATIMTVLFLAHLAMVFRDMDAFRMHRRAIRDMVRSRGGLDKLNQDLWVKSSVRQFETWWSQLHGDPMFAEHKATRLMFYPKPPFTAEIRKIVDKIPPGFQKLASNGRLSMEMIILLGRISHHQRLGEIDQSLLSGVFTGSRTSPRRHNDFDEACPSLCIPGPNFEKYLSFALLLYCSITFSPKRSLLEACHLVFGIPRSLLTGELALFSAKSPHETKCFAWMWLVLITSWIVANRTRSISGTSLSRQLMQKYPELCAWTAVKDILREFFSSEALLEPLQQLWEDLKLEDAEV
ncbi:Fungal specific transcription factor domain-containing protein [Cladophialophora immunda]|nr:Fungal specific transcription factor domain-containing protein [Cladophialophora immunda]